MTNSWSGLHLPKDLFLEIKSFLTESEFWQLLMSSRILLSDVASETRNISLNSDNVYDFLLKNKNIRKDLLSKMKDPFHQLHLRLTHGEGLRLKYEATSFPSGSLSLSWDYRMGCDLEWVKILSSCFRLATYGGGSWAIPTFVNLRELKICNDLGIKKIPPLPTNLKKLSLRCCRQLKFVSFAAALDEFHIESCHNLADVNGLGNVRILSIIDCYRIQDISGLTNNQSWTILRSQNIATGPTPRNVKKIHSDVAPSGLPGISFPHLKDVSAICRKSMLELEGDLLENRPHPLTDPFLGGLGNILCLYLKYCSLDDLSCLNGVAKSVTLISCKYLRNFSALRNVPRVHIESCEGFRDGREVENVHRLTLVNCTNFRVAHMLGKVHHLQLFTQIDSFLGLGSVPIVEFDCKDPPTDIPSLGMNNRKIVFSSSLFNGFRDLQKFNNLFLCYDMTDDSKTVTFLRK
jgi:hypothetical protein